MELVRADVDGIPVPLGDVNDGIVATVGLHWIAGGDVDRWTETRPGMHANHQTRIALIGGSVSVTERGTEIMFLGLSDVRTPQSDWDVPRITHYTEINRGGIVGRPTGRGTSWVRKARGPRFQSLRCLMLRVALESDTRLRGMARTCTFQPVEDRTHNGSPKGRSAPQHQPPRAGRPITLVGQRGLLTLTLQILN